MRERATAAYAVLNGVNFLLGGITIFRLDADVDYGRLRDAFEAIRTLMNTAV